MDAKDRTPTKPRGTGSPEVERLSDGRFVDAKHSSTRHGDERTSGSVVYMTSTEAKNEFGRVLDAVARNHTVVISRRNANRAVVISVEQYEALTGTTESALDALTAEFDALLERMQKPAAIEGMLAAFRSSPDALGRAAVAAARRDPT